jgi:hypothetical protein
MLDDSFFVSATVHEKEVELSDGKRHKLHFRELPYIDVLRYQSGAQSDDEDERAASNARLIAAALCNPDGTPAISLEKAALLKPEVGAAIFSAAVAINTPTKKKPSKPEVTPTSGTS